MPNYLLYDIVVMLFKLYGYIVIARCVLSFFPMDSPVQNNQFAAWIYKLTDPVLRPFEKLIPPINLGGMYLDISPIAFFIIYDIVEAWVINHI